MPAAQQAGILCADAGFQRFAARQSGAPAPRFSPSAAAEWLRRECGIDTRATLSTDPAARARFEALQTTFDAWRGRIAASRS